MIVRGGTEATIFSWITDIPDHVHRVRVWWEFYQREHKDGAVCVIDGSKSFPTGGLPYLKVDGGENNPDDEGCYNDVDSDVVQVPDKRRI
jgi:hypothetical protein